MKRSRRGWVLGLGAAAGLYGVWNAGSWIFDKRGEVAVENQMWIERMPREPRDLIRQLAFIEHNGRHFGLAAVASHWRIRGDRFLWKREAGQFELRFPQNDSRVVFALRTWRCEGEAPKPFELCIELTGDSGRKIQLYSRDDWKIRPRADGAPEIEDAPIGSGVLSALADPGDAPETTAPTTAEPAARTTAGRPAFFE